MPSVMPMMSHRSIELNPRGPEDEAGSDPGVRSGSIDLLTRRSLAVTALNHPRAVAIML
jgi:hypothetical protein